MKLLSKRRKVAALVTVILAIALAVTGTMAAFIFDDEVINEWGDIVTPGGNGHDDFEGGEDKDVYFENYGSSTLYVRIRLDEYMEFGTGTAAKPLVKNAKRADKKTWSAHIPAAKGTPHICAPGNLETPGVDFHDYWTWKMGGAEGERYYLPTNPTSPDAGKVQKGPYYTIADKATNPLLKPIPEAAVVTMAKWVEDGRQIGNFWVVDTDGWAYWATPLLSKSVTGLLLNEVKLTNKPNQSYYYAINVRFFATDEDDIGSMRSTATPEGNILIDLLLQHGAPPAPSLDDALDDAIKRANDALDDAAANPDKYTQDSIDDLRDARDDALDVKNKGGSATDQEKQDAIDAIDDNLPLVQAAPSNLGPATLPGGIVGTAYTAAFTATSATPVAWSIDSGSLPSGLALNASTGAITGTPSAAGTYNFTVKATNAGGSATKAMAITIGIGAVQPVISTTSLPSAMVNTAYSHTLALSAGTAPITWSIDSGSLPAGLTLNAGTGVISGTPTADGTFNFTVKAANAAGSATKALSLVVGTTSLSTKTPDDSLLGFKSKHHDDPDLCHSTQINIGNGMVLTPARRYASVALEDILSDPADVAGTTATAVDPALAGVIKTYNNTFGSLGDGKRSVISEWKPLNAAAISQLDSSVSTVTYDENDAPILTTEINLTNGDKVATVTVTFYFTYSLVDI